MDQRSQADPGALAERRAGLVRLFASSRIAGNTGMRLSYDDEGRAVFTQAYNPDFDHALGGIHGGLIATLLDNAGWFTAAPYYAHWVATVEFSVRLHRPVEGQGLVARGELLRLGRRLASAKMRVEDGQGRLVATGTGTFTDSSVPMRLPD